MKILLTQDVPHLGKAGDVKAVADGYARNYLIPRGMAVIAVRGVLQQVEVDQQMETRRQARLQQETQKLATTLRRVTLTFHVRAGENEQLYGSITNANIAQALEEQVGSPIDRRKIGLEEPIRRLGTYRVPIRLGDGEVPHIGVVVRQEEE